MGFCSNPLEKHHVGDHVDDLGLVRLIIGILYALTALLTIFWIHLQERNAQAGSSGAVKSVIFPIFTKMMWLSAFSSVLLALLMIFVPVHLTHGPNDWIGKIAYPVGFTIQHAVMEGIAFLLMNKGLGNHAAKNTLKYVGLWCMFTFVVTLASFHEHFTAPFLFYTWDLMQLFFYLALWLAPLNRLYRRPAAYPYARFWFWFRVMEIFFFTISYAEDSVLQSIGHCGYVFGPLLIFTIFQPLVCYHTLLSDSNWWQGFGVGEGDRSTPGSINSPMWGMDLTLHSAQTLAKTLDEMRNSGSAKLVNFAHIALDTQKMIGQGSFSRVYVGTYRMQRCAIKLVYSLDLTSEEINKVAAEATLLNSVQHKHVVHIYGVSVLPPSVCILLELCAYGSLSDVLRGSPNDVNRPLTLSYLDKMYLALGCAKGLAALHSMGQSLVHRDIKSFNFLVDAQLNAKLADLELGMDSQDVGEVNPENLLPNWAAPEVLLGQPYTQESDVYSLSLVLWEIASGVIPYSDVQGTSTDKFIFIRTQVADLNNRLSIPRGFEAMAPVIEAGWNSEGAQRPTALQMVEALGVIWRAVSRDSLVSNLLCEFTEDGAEVVSDGVSNAGVNHNTKVIGKNISEMYQTWQASPDFKKHIKAMVPSTPLAPPQSETRPNSVSLVASHESQILSGKIYVTEYCKGNVGGDGGVEMLRNRPLDASSPLLQEMFDSINEHPDWNDFVTSAQPSIIVSRNAPHVIVCASSSWSRLTGYKSVQVFGHSLDEFLVLGSSARPKRSRAQSPPSDEPFGDNYQAIGAFYDDLTRGVAGGKERSGLFFPRTNSSSAPSAAAALAGKSGLADVEGAATPSAHALISIYKSSTQEELPLSIHGFLLCSPDPSPQPSPTHDASNPARSFPSNGGGTSSSTSSAFCVIFMNSISHFCDEDTNTSSFFRGRAKSQARRSAPGGGLSITKNRPSIGLSDRSSFGIERQSLSDRM